MLEGERQVNHLIYDDVIKSSKHFWLSRILVKYYYLFIMTLILLQVVSLILTFKYSLFTIYSIESRDLFYTGDPRTSKLDVENAL